MNPAQLNDRGADLVCALCRYVEINLSAAQIAREAAYLIRSALHDGRLLRSSREEIATLKRLVREMELGTAHGGGVA